MSTASVVAPVFDHVVDQVDKAATAAINVIDLTQNAAFATVEQVAAKADSEADGLVVEVRAAKDRFITLLKQLGDAALAAV